MVWIFAAVILLLALLSPRSRKFGFALAGAAILIVVVLILLNERNKPNPAPTAIDSTSTPATHGRMPDLDDYLIERQDKDDPEAKNRISLTEVRFGQIKATYGPQANAIQSIQARLYNDSKRFSLTDYSYYLVVQDCVGSELHDPSAAQCTTVYDRRQRGTPVVVPPNQARDIMISIPVDSVTFAPTFKILGKPRIELTPTDTRAYRSSEHPQAADVELLPSMLRPGRPTSSVLNGADRRLLAAAGELCKSAANQRSEGTLKFGGGWRLGLLERPGE